MSSGHAEYRARVMITLAVIGGLQLFAPKLRSVTTYDRGTLGVFAARLVRSTNRPQKLSVIVCMPPATHSTLAARINAMPLLSQSGGMTISLSASAINSEVVSWIPQSRFTFGSRVPGQIGCSRMTSRASVIPANAAHVASPVEPTRTTFVIFG